MIKRLLTALALASLLALPGAVRAAPVGLTGMLGFESGDNYSGLELRFDGDVVLSRLSPQVALLGVGTLSYSHLSADGGGSADSWDLIPALRVLFDVKPRLNLYADLGLGVNFLRTDGPDSTNATMRIGGGIQYALSSHWQVVGDAAFHPHWGDYDKTTFSFLGGVRYQ